MLPAIPPPVLCVFQTIQKGFSVVASKLLALLQEQRNIERELLHGCTPAQRDALRRLRTVRFNLWHILGLDKQKP